MPATARTLGHELPTPEGARRRRGVLRPGDEHHGGPARASAGVRPDTLLDFVLGRLVALETVSGASGRHPWRSGAPLPRAERHEPRKSGNLAEARASEPLLLLETRAPNAAPGRGGCARRHRDLCVERHGRSGASQLAPRTHASARWLWRALRDGPTPGAGSEKRDPEQSRARLDLPSLRNGDAEVRHGKLRGRQRSPRTAARLSKPARASSRFAPLRLRVQMQLRRHAQYGYASEREPATAR